MKKRRNIFFKIFLLIVLLFFQGINEHSDIDAQRYYIETTLDPDNVESRLTPDNDLSDEDQIEQSDYSELSEQHECQKFSVCTLPLLNIPFVSVWQPPKVF